MSGAFEEFADFYRTGRFRADDWAQTAIARHMSERNRSFARTIASQARCSRAVGAVSEGIDRVSLRGSADRLDEHRVIGDIDGHGEQLGIVLGDPHVVVEVRVG